MNTARFGLARFVLDNSLLLLAGTGAAVVWANLDIGSYEGVAHPLHFAVNDIGMVFFFALAAKEVFEATLPGGALASPGVPFLHWQPLLAEWCCRRSYTWDSRGCAARPIWREGGRSPARRTSPSRRWWPVSCSPRVTPRFHSSCCSPSRMMRS